MADYLATLLEPLSVVIMGVATVATVVFAVMAYHAWTRPPRKVFEPKVLSEWRRTEHIDFQGPDDVMLSEQDDLEAQFVLLVQEQRLVANISGLPTPEIRWRYATKGEAKEIAHMIAVHRELQKVRGGPQPTWKMPSGSATGTDVPNNVSTAADLRELDGLNEVEARI